LFARSCVLVEGRTESLALPELFRARGLDVLKEGIGVISVEGLGNIAKWHRLFTALGIKSFCIFDTDSDRGHDAGRLARRTDIAAALGLEGDPAESATVLGQPLYVSEGYATLDPNFEGAMKELVGNNWTRLHEKALAFVGDSKPLRARYAAQQGSGKVG
jgi:putative ATP-dependent endonuclease of OLD family